jgi:hypothetical protein
VVFIQKNPPSGHEMCQAISCSVAPFDPSMFL